MTQSYYNDYVKKIHANIQSHWLAEDAIRLDGIHYKDIVALSARQVTGATSLAGLVDECYSFLKEISLNGDFQPAILFFLHISSE